MDQVQNQVKAALTRRERAGGRGEHTNHHPETLLPRRHHTMGVKDPVSYDQSAFVFPVREERLQQQAERVHPTPPVAPTHLGSEERCPDADPSAGAAAAVAVSQRSQTELIGHVLLRQPVSSSLEGAASPSGSVLRLFSVNI